MATNPDNGRKLSQEEVEILSDMGLLEYVNLEQEKEGPMLLVQVYETNEISGFPVMMYEHDCEEGNEVSTIHEFMDKMTQAYKAMGFQTPITINLHDTVFEGEPIYFDPMK